MSQKRRCYYRKLIPQQVFEIKKRYATGTVSQQQLATDYNISKTMVRSILQGTSWKWLNAAS